MRDSGTAIRLEDRNLGLEVGLLADDRLRYKQRHTAFAKLAKEVLPKMVGNGAA